MRLKWIFARLRTMSGREILRRLADVVGLGTLYWLQLLRRMRRTPPIRARHLSFCTEARGQLFDPRPEGQTIGVTRAAEWCLGHPWAWREESGIWRTAPDTGRTWPSRVFWRIDYRPGNPYGDIRVAWEPSRLQHLMGLAASAADGDNTEDAIGRLAAILLSWWRENPPYVGIHYVSAMECALRLIAILHAVDLVRHRLRDRDAVWTAVADITWHHWQLIRRRLSLHSSAGNHTVAETVGLLYVGVLFPEIQGSRRVAEQALDLLADEMDRQVLPDGGSLEQAPGYLQFIADLGRLAVNLLEYAGWPVPPQLAGAVDRAESHLAMMGDWYGESTRPGDYDEGSAIGFALRPTGNGNGSPVDEQPLLSCEATGFSVLNSQLGGHLGCMVDHGPHGMAPNYGHAHADALSVLVRWRGHPILVDSGTYTYNGASQLRAHFRGTAAHNTVRVDGLDQAEQHGAFLWSAFAGGELVRRESLPEGDSYLLAHHAGYARVGVHHWRGVAVLTGRGLLIWDHLSGDGSHRIELNWHMAGTWSEVSGGAMTQVEGDRLAMIVHGASAQLRRGDASTPASCRSPGYGKLAPAMHLSADREGSLPIEFCTEVSLPHAPVSDPDRQSVAHRFRGWVEGQ